jgi:hypothetical protein
LLTKNAAIICHFRSSNELGDFFTDARTAAAISRGPEKFVARLRVWPVAGNTITVISIRGFG